MTGFERQLILAFLLAVVLVPTFLAAAWEAKRK